MNSVLIKGMKKPTACYKCPLRTGKYCGILTENEKCADDGVLPHCPIVEVPTPHGRLIDAYEVMKSIKEDYCDSCEYKPTMCHDCHISDVLFIIDDAPTVIESEEQEHE